MEKLTLAPYWCLDQGFAFLISEAKNLVDAACRCMFGLSPAEMTLLYFLMYINSAGGLKIFTTPAEFTGRESRVKVGSADGRAMFRAGHLFTGVQNVSYPFLYACHFRMIIQKICTFPHAWLGLPVLHFKQHSVSCTMLVIEPGFQAWNGWKGDVPVLIWTMYVMPSVKLLTPLLLDRLKGLKQGLVDSKWVYCG